MLSAIELKEQIQAIGADLVGVTGVDTPLLREYGIKYLCDILLEKRLRLAQNIVGADFTKDGRIPRFCVGYSIGF